VTVVERLQQFLPEESDDTPMAYGLSIAGHVIIALLLLLGLLERIELIPVIEVPVEIVMETPAAAARQDVPASPKLAEAARQDAPASSKLAEAARHDTPASLPAASGSNEQKRPSGIPAVADVDKRAKAPLAALNVNGIDRPKQPGHDGGDPNPGSDPAGIPVPPTDGGVASGNASPPSSAIAPIGPAPPQTTARQPGEDELTALKEQKFECGAKAKRPELAVAVRKQARVRGFATEAQALAMMRSTQAQRDRHINPNYIRNQRVFVETLDGTTKFAVLLPAGLTVNVGDVIEYDQGHIDPSDSCQYIPNLAVSKL
jgi:hypothetical protein